MHQMLRGPSEPRSTHIEGQLSELRPSCILSSESSEVQSSFRLLPYRGDHNCVIVSKFVFKLTLLCSPVFICNVLKCILTIH